MAGEGVKPDVVVSESHHAAEASGTADRDLVTAIGAARQHLGNGGRFEVSQVQPGRLGR
jgi:hypothetical protein